MRQKEIIERLKNGDRLINNAIVGPFGATHPDTITDRQIEAVKKKVKLTEEVDGPLTTRRIKE